MTHVLGLINTLYTFSSLLSLSQHGVKAVTLTLTLNHHNPKPSLYYNPSRIHPNPSRRRHPPSSPLNPKIDFIQPQIEF